MSSSSMDNFLNSANATFVTELYSKYLNDKASIDSSWEAFFNDLDEDGRALLEEMRGASWAPNTNQVISDETSNGVHTETVPVNRATSAPTNLDAAETRKATLDSIQALMLIRAYRVRGHLQARLDPLALHPPAIHPELDPKTYGFTGADWDRPIFINYVLGLESATLREIVDILNKTYCGNIGIEFMHMQEPEEKAWIQSHIEGMKNKTDFSKEDKKYFLDRLIIAEEFEHFLNKKYIGTKRFGIDGGEANILGLDEMIRKSANAGVREVVIGMAHRGRLNVLANIMGKSFQAIFSEFQGNPANPEDVQGSGDVKYHLGTSSDKDYDGNNVHLSLTANPSHLEAVDTVVLGKVRAKQHQYSDANREKVLGVLLHGDAAFAGQGMVAETLDLSQLKGYRTGGTIHLITNNQIGFTTTPAHARTGHYCTEVGKIVQAPIFHVNGDDPEAVVHVARLAAEYRDRFKKDVIVDIVCYRRYGHNEADEPAFTQPLMYKKIAKHPSVRTLYSERLIKENTITEEENNKMLQDFRDHLEKDYEAANSYKTDKADWLEGKWSGLEVASGGDRRGKTSVSMDFLKQIGHQITEPPKDFKLNSKIIRQIKAKREFIDKGENIDWATAEALAYGTLLCEGIPVRLSGQDCRRGTFSQRHAVWIDQDTEDDYIPLNNLRYGQAPFEVIDSPLSEVGVLGFEYGYSLAEPHMLVLWEAQFGDFSNGAQVIIDQFISSGESKWLRMSGLVMLLPHGYEGQGPEHSSARLERYLQLCAEDNIQVANCTTPASYFHILRRQIHRNFRKPLIIMTPKSLLRHKACVSSLEDMAEGTSFHRLLHEGDQRPKKPKRFVLCSGKVYYDLLEEKQKRGLKDVSLLRLEQLYPFPDKAIREEFETAKNADVVWCQEEPQNMGAWNFVLPRLMTIMSEMGMKQTVPAYAGREEAASPATGLMKKHIEQQKKLVDEALTF